MKKSSKKQLRKSSTTLVRYGRGRHNGADTGTDPTNTTFTIATTASGMPGRGKTG